MGDSAPDAANGDRVTQLEAQISGLQQQLSDVLDTVAAHQALFERLYAAGVLPAVDGGGL